MRKLASLFIAFFTLLKYLNFNTLYFNFKYLPFHKAIKFPFFLSRHMILRKPGGKITIDSPRFYTGMVYIGYRKIGIFNNKQSKAIWDVRGEVIFRGASSIGGGCKFVVQENAVLSIGDNVAISDEATFVCYKEIFIGDNTGISWESLVIDTDLHPIFNEKGEVINEPQPIIIGNKAWVGVRNTILKGAVIPDNSIVGACSLTTKKFTETHCIYAGNPARLVKTGIDFKTY